MHGKEAKVDGSVCRSLPENVQSIHVFLGIGNIDIATRSVGTRGSIQHFFLSGLKSWELGTDSRRTTNKSACIGPLRPSLEVDGMGAMC